MEEKKGLFELLDAKSAMILGVVGGVLFLGTVGFLVLGYLVFKGNLSLGGKALANTNAEVSPSAVVDNAPANVPTPVVPKTNRPKVDLFVMSYCPFGLQMEKAYVPAWELLKDKADIDIKFVSYAMHGIKEVEENTRQYCLKEEQSKSYLTYLKCFMGSGDYQACLAASGVNTSKLDSCVSATNKKFGIMDKYNDQKTWLSGQYPLYPIDSDLNNKYGVQGSPTLVINGAQADASRTPEAVKEAICAGFTNPPAECSQNLSNSSFSPGFGTTVGSAGAAASAGCAT